MFHHTNDTEHIFVQPRRASVRSPAEETEFG
jgi:hypothetical protein